MSLVLDALRRGRGRQMPRTNQHAAQTDAVLHTLGYPRSKPTASAGRWKRSSELVAAVVLSILAAWGAVVWLT